MTPERTFTTTWYHAPGSRALIVRFLPLCLAFASSCGAPPPPANPPPAPPAPAPAPAPWSRFEEISGFPDAGEAFANSGHPGAGELGRVRVSAEARPGYEALVTDSALPDGALVALFHFERGGTVAGPVYVMEKRGGTWTYLALTSRGVVLDGGATLCRGCHDAAVGDSLFGLPRKPAAARP